MFRVQNKELENKNDDLESEKIQHDDTIEELYREISQLKKNVEEYTSENIAIKDKLKKNKVEIKELKKKNDQDKIDSAVDNDSAKEVLKSKLDESEQKVIELRCILEGYKFEYSIETVNSEEGVEGAIKSGDEDVPSTSKCDYASDSENEMKKHLEIPHEIICTLCDLTFSSELLL